MSAPAEAMELRRVVWRHEYGYLSFDLARDSGLEDEYRHALKAQDALSGDESILRDYAPALLREFDDARRGAERALYAEPDLRAALHHLLRCRERMARMQEVLQADAALRRAVAAHGRLWAAARVRRLRELPCVDGPARLLAAARARMREGCWARAGHLAEAALRQAAALDPGEPPDPARAAALREAFSDMRALCTATRGLLADPAADAGGDGTLEAAEALVDEGLLSLAGRVAEELGARLAPRLRFRTALEEGTGAEDDVGARLAVLRAGLGDAPGEEPWTAATELLWRTRMEDGMRRIQNEQARLERLHGAGAGDLHHQPRDV